MIIHKRGAGVVPGDPPPPYLIEVSDRICRRHDAAVSDSRPADRLASRKPGTGTNQPSMEGTRKMATGETGFDDVTYDLISVQYHSLKAGHDYGQYVRDAENAGRDDIAQFFREVMEQDSRAAEIS